MKMTDEENLSEEAQRVMMWDNTDWVFCIPFMLT